MVVAIVLSLVTVNQFYPELTEDFKGFLEFEEGMNRFEEPELAEEFNRLEESESAEKLNRFEALVGYDGLVGAKCWDPDGENEFHKSHATENPDAFFVAGTSQLPAREETDICKDSNTVIEWVCGTGDKLMKKDIACPSGYFCNDGACMTCMDSDPYDDLFVRGEVKLLNGTKMVTSPDKCTSTFDLSESYCDVSGQIGTKTLSCPIGCTAGTCKPQWIKTIPENPIPGDTVLIEIFMPDKEISYPFGSSNIITIDPGTIALYTPKPDFLMLKIYDDGTNGDKIMGDNIFTAKLTQTKMEGTYKLNMIFDKKDSAYNFSINHNIIVSKKYDCNELIPGHNEADKNRANIVFSGYEYKDVAMLKDHALRMIKSIKIDEDAVDQTIFRLEPFNGEEDKFNFWYVDAIGTYNKLVGNADYLHTSCVLPNKHTINLVNSSLRSAAVGRDMIVSSSLNNGEFFLDPPNYSNCEQCVKYGKNCATKKFTNDFGDICRIVPNSEYNTSFYCTPEIWEKFPLFPECKISGICRGKQQSDLLAMCTQKVIVTPDRKPDQSLDETVIHEWGHVFGGLVDEYIEVSNLHAKPTKVPGNSSCEYFPSKNACETHYRNKGYLGDGCKMDDIVDCTMHVDKDFILEVQCHEGCILGEFDAYRPVFNSIMRYISWKSCSYGPYNIDLLKDELVKYTNTKINSSLSAVDASNMKILQDLYLKYPPEKLQIFEGNLIIPQNEIPEDQVLQLKIDFNRYNEEIFSMNSISIEDVYFNFDKTDVNDSDYFVVMRNADGQIVFISPYTFPLKRIIEPDPEWFNEEGNLVDLPDDFEHESDVDKATFDVILPVIREALSIEIYEKGRKVMTEYIEID